MFAKTIRNTYIILSSLCTWAEREFGLKHVVRPITTSESPERVIEPLPLEDVKALLKACEYTEPWHNRLGTRTLRPTAVRDKAVVLFLLDTGVRAEEFCKATMADVDQKTGRVKVAGKARGRGSKERIVYLGRSTRREQYVQETPEAAALFDFLERHWPTEVTQNHVPSL